MRQGEHKPRKRWKDSRFGHEFVIAGIAIGGGRAGSLPPFPMLRLCCLYTKCLNKILINMYSNNTLFWTKFWTLNKIFEQNFELFEILNYLKLNYLKLLKILNKNLN